MKILIIHTHYHFKGGEDAVVEHEIELLKQYYEVEVLYFQNHLGFQGALQFLLSIWNFFSMREVKKKAKEFQPDIIHVHNWHFALGPLFFRAISKLGIPIVHTIHNYRLLCPSAILFHNQNLFTNSLTQRFPWTSIRNKVYRSSRTQTFWVAFTIWLHKKIGTWNKIDTYVCLTPFAVEVFQKSNFGISKERFVIKPNFTTVIENSNAIKREKHYLFIGRLSEEKGLEILIKAFQNTSFKVRIAGDGPLKEKVLKVCEKSTNIIYLGNLSKEKVIEELYKCEALIFPSVWYEGMPMTIIEAFSTSAPVIASRIGAMSSMISDAENGFLFESGNENDLIRTVNKFNLLSSSEKEQIYLNTYHSYQNQYSPKLQKLYFDSIYNKVLKEKKDTISN